MRTLTLERIYQHADETYPREACGLIFGEDAVHCATNIQDELHALNPAVYTRSGCEAYTLDLESGRLLEQSFTSETPVTVIYHSHPDVGAYFSDEDLGKALYEGVPLYPVDYVVIDTQAGHSIGAKRFTFSNGVYTLTETYTRHPEAVNE